MANGVKESHVSTNASKKSDKPHEDIPEYRYNCDDCKEKFTDCFNFDNHKLTIHDCEQNYQCNECGISFISEWKLKKHMKIH